MSEDKKKPLPVTPEFSADGIRELAALLTETGLTEIEIEASGARIRVARGVTQHVAASAPVIETNTSQPLKDEPPSAASEAANHPGAVVSPMVGTAYLSPEPGAPAFIAVGDQVSEGQTLLIVEAMKTMNPIPAPKAGKVTRLLVQNEEPVEYGQPLIIIE